MKKQLLFIISTLDSGGVSKSISTLLNVIDTNRFDVDVLVLNPTGVFMNLLPNTISIKSDLKTQLFFSKFPNNVLLLIKNKFFKAAVLRLFAAVVMQFNKGVGALFLAKGIVKLTKTYDLAVDYNGQHQLYYLVDYVKATKKVSFFHSDYAQWNYYFATDKRYYPKVDQIYTISPICVASLKHYFPHQAARIELFENISSIAFLTQLASYPIKKLHQNSLLTIGHLTERKGTLLALQAALLLHQQGIDFVWCFIGADSNDHDYRAMVNKYNLNEKIIFLGVLANPYPYLKNAKMVVHLSYFEGKSIALDEAKIFLKPTVVTNFSTVNDQFTHNYNALITDFQPAAVAENIVNLLFNKIQQDFFIANLKNDLTSNECEIEKLYQLLES